MERCFPLNGNDRLLPMGLEPVSRECVLFWQSLTMDDAARLCMAQCIAFLRGKEAGTLVVIDSVDGENPVCECLVGRVVRELRSLKAAPWPSQRHSIVIRIPWANLHKFVSAQVTESAAIDAERRVLAYLWCVSVLKKTFGTETSVLKVEVS
jgi:hypothetical protein